MDSLAGRTGAVRFGGFQFDSDKGELRRRGNRVKLQGQPIRLLALLLQRPGEVVTRDQMRVRLWPEDTFVDFEHSLNTAIKKLRRALGDSAARPRFVETVARQGYRFIAPVEPLEGVTHLPPSQPNDASPADSGNAGSKTLVPSMAPQRPGNPPPVLLTRSARRLLGFGILVLLAAAALVAVLRRGSLLVRSPRLSLLVSRQVVISDPAISPDGKMLAYVASRNGLKKIYVRRVAGGREIPLTDDNAREAQPAFSPDDERVAFTRYPAGHGAPEICIAPVLGGEFATEVQGGSFPAWSWDGARLAFIRREPGKAEALVTSTIGGRNQRVLLTGNSTYPFLLHPAWSPDGKCIAVERSMGGESGEIWRVSSQGRGLTRLPTGAPETSAHDPVFTADGKALIYSSNRGGATNLWLQSLAGGGAQQLSQGPGPDAAPSVSREGSIVFLSSHWQDRLFVRKLSGGSAIALLSNAPFLWAPAISPDGQEVAFSRAQPDGEWHIWIAPLAGGKARELTNGALRQIYPRFSPDGKWVIYFTWSSTKNRIWRVSAGGGPAEPLTPPSEDDSYGDVSPDGGLLAFARNEGGESHITMLPLGGGVERRITDSPSTLPRWSPDGRWIAFSSGRGYEGGIFIIHPDGTGIRKLTPSGGWPVWLPDGKRIAFSALRPDGTQQIDTVRLSDRKVETFAGAQFRGDNDPFDFSHDGKLMVYTNGVVFSSEIWLLNFHR